LIYSVLITKVLAKRSLFPISFQIYFTIADIVLFTFIRNLQEKMFVGYQH